MRLYLFEQHWLNKHSLDNRSNARHQLLNGATEQVCLAALVATLNPKQHKQNVAQSAQVFAKPKSTSFFLIENIYWLICKLL